MFEFVISVRPDSRDRLDAIAGALGEAGLRNVELSRRFGLIMGSADPSVTTALQAVDGVKSVRQGETYSAQGSEGE